MNTQVTLADQANSLKTQHRALANRIGSEIERTREEMAKALDGAMKGFHERTGLHIERIDVDILSHKVIKEQGTGHSAIYHIELTSNFQP